MRVSKNLFLAIVSLGLLASVSLNVIVGCLQPVTFRGHTGAVHYVLSSPDGKTLASVSRDDKTIRLWDVTTREERATLQGYRGDVDSVAFSPDGKTLASGGEDKTIKLWDALTGKELAAFDGHTTRVGSVAFSPDGKMLASGNDKTIKLWDALTGKELATLDGHTTRVGSVTLAFSPDGKTLASGGDKTIKLWNVVTGKELATLALGEPTYRTMLAFSPDGKTLASVQLYQPIVKLWDLITGKVREVEYLQWIDDDEPDSPTIGSIAFSPDGKTLASGNDVVVGLWDVASGKNTAVFGRGRRPLLPSIHHLLDRIGPSWEDRRDNVSSVSFTPDGMLVALGVNDKAVLLWKVAVAPNGPKGKLPSE